MISFELNGAIYNIPTDWSDVPFSKFVQLNDKTLFERVSLLSGLKKSDIEKFSFKTLSLLFTCFEFLDTAPNEEEVPVKFQDFTLGFVEFYKTVSRANKNSTIIEFAEQILAHYSENLKGENTEMCLSYLRAIQIEIEKFSEKYKRLGEYKPTPEELQAGIHSLDKHGSKVLIYKLSKMYQITAEEVLKRNACEVYDFLLIDHDTAQIERNLEKIAIQKQRAKNKRK